MNNFACPHCGVGLAPQITRCPVCGRFIHEKTEPQPTSYPIIRNRLHPSQLVDNMVRAMWITVVICLIVNLYLNWGTWTREAFWSLYVLSTAVVLHVSLFRPLRLKVYYWMEAILQILVFLAYFIFIDWMMDGAASWSVIWVLPIVMLVLSVTIGIWLSIRRRDMGNLLLFALSLFLMTLILWLLDIYWLKNVLVGYTVVPAFTAFLCAGSVFMFFAAFRFRWLVQTLRKRFHL